MYYLDMSSDKRCPCGKPALKETYDWPELHHIPSLCDTCVHESVYISNGRLRFHPGTTLRDIMRDKRNKELEDIPYGVSAANY